jgi:hypothetical protein
MNFNPFGSSPRGFQQIADLSAAVGLTVPDDGASFIVVNPESQNVRWRDDGTSPTAEVGMLLVADTEFTYQGDLSKIQFIEVTSGAKLNVSYYAAVGGLLKP